MHNMTNEEIYEFLKGQPYTGHLATVREDGRPHVATIWIIVDGEEIVFTTWHTSVKGKNLQRTGYAALSVDDNTSPYTAVHFEGPVELISDPAESRKWAGRLGGRYMGEERAESSLPVTGSRANGFAVCALSICPASPPSPSRG